jgi:alpha-tubulin suppressor-like RCC1 family protein
MAMKRTTIFASTGLIFALLQAAWLAPSAAAVDTNWVAVDAGFEHTCALKSARTLWCWGRNDRGQVGDGSSTRRLRPVKITSTSRSSSSPSNWASVSSDTWNNCAIKFDGTLWCWGDNTYGQLGDGTTTTRRNPTKIASTTTKWASVEVGQRHACAIKTDRTLWCWGYNRDGNLGNGDFTGARRLKPTRITSETTWASVSAGANHTCATKTDSTLWCWGNERNGALGNGSDGFPSPKIQFSPVKVTSGSPPQSNWSKVSAGYQYNCATKTDATLWCWGSNSHGNLGDGTNTDRLKPKQIAAGPVLFGTNRSWTSISVEYRHTCALKSNNSLSCWGFNGRGSVGDGTTTERRTPILIAWGPRRGGQYNVWSQISAGSDHTCALKTDQGIACWGENSHGQLGDGTTTDRLEPVAAG